MDILTLKKWLERELESEAFIEGTIYTYEELLGGAAIEELDSEVIEALIAKYSEE